MLQPNRSASRLKVKSASVPAPFGGLNSRDSIDLMKPTDAIIMNNFFPTVEKLTLREGYTSFCSGIGSGDVETRHWQCSQQENRFVKQQVSDYGI